MKTDFITNSRPKVDTEQKKSPGRSFDRILKSAHERDVDHGKKEEKEESIIIDGPVSTQLRSQASFPNGAVENLPALSKVATEIIQKLKPQLISISENGISKTTMWLKTELLEEIQVEIDHYDTDPCKFYLTFRGNEKTQQLISAHHAALATSLKGALPTFHCSILPTTYRDDFSKKRRSEKNNKNSLVKSDKVRYSANNTGV